MIVLVPILYAALEPPEYPPALPGTVPDQVLLLAGTRFGEVR